MTQAILLGLAVVTAACGSSESATAECKALIEAYCNVWASCTTPPGDEEAFRQILAQCDVRSNDALACDDAESTGPGYDQCLTEIATITCVPPFGVEGASLPESCSGVIQLK